MAISSSRSPRNPKASAWPSAATSASAGTSAGSTQNTDSPAKLTCGGGSAVPGLPVHLRKACVSQVPALQPGRDHTPDPAALPRRRRGVDDLLHVPDRDVVAAEPGDDRDCEPLAQAALGMGVLAGPLPVDPEPVRGQVVGDQVRAAQRHVGRIGLQPLGDVGQPGGELVLGRRLALLPLAVLVPDRPPAALIPTRAAAPGGRPPGPTHKCPAGCRAAGFCLLGDPAVSQLWGFRGETAPRGRLLRHGDPLSSCVIAGRGPTMKAEMAPALGLEPRTCRLSRPSLSSYGAVEQ